MATTWSRLRFRLPSSTPSPSISHHLRISTQIEPPDFQTFLLPSSRIIGYATYGSPTGRPLFYFHGFPTSRLEAVALSKVASKHNIRVIAPDRPGFGLSSFQPDRKIVDWPADVAASADHLGLDRFAVLGCSGGGPFAVACANASNKELDGRLTAVGVAAGSGPWVSGTQDLSWYSKVLAWSVRRCPEVIRVLTDRLVGALRWITNTDMVARRLNRWLETTETEDTQGSTDQRRINLLRCLFDGFSQGSRGFVWEAKLLSADWGFKFEDVPFKGVKVWRGENDTNAPVGMARWMVERLPEAERTVYEGENHYNIAAHLEEMLLELMGEDKGDEERERT